MLKVNVMHQECAAPQGGAPKLRKRDGGHAQRKEKKKGSANADKK